MSDQTQVVITPITPADVEKLISGNLAVVLNGLKALHALNSDAKVIYTGEAFVVVIGEKVIDLPMDADISPEALAQAFAEAREGVGGRVLELPLWERE